MSQNDMTIDNSTGANVRADINSALQAIATNNSGSSAPSTTFASQFFADTNAGIMKLRNTSNNDYVNLFTLAGGIDVDAASNFNEDVTFQCASGNIIFDKSDNALEFSDSVLAKFGAGDDLTITHNGTDSRLINSTGDLKIRSDVLKLETTTGEEYIRCTANGSVDLFNDNVVKLTTNADGFRSNDNVKAQFGNSSDLTIYHDGADSYIDNATGNLNIRVAGTEKGIRVTPNGSVNLYHNDVQKLNTASGGVEISGTCTATAFSGDGSALTGVGGTTINNNANNRVITGSGTANTLEGEASLTFDAGLLKIDDLSGTAGKGRLEFGNSAEQFIEGFDTGNGGSGAYLRFGDGSTEIMRIRTTSGGLMIGDDGSTRIGEPRLHVFQTGSGVNVASFFYNGTDDRDAIIIRHNGSSGSTGRTMINFANSSGNGVGNIRADGSNVVFNTSSDYRLKENEVSISDGITRLKQLKPYRFNFKITPSITQDGFFAHEVQTVVPTAVTGDKDDTENVLYRDDDEIPSGKSIGDVKETIPKYQSIDHSKLVPVLVAAVQELITKVETLETA